MFLLFGDQKCLPTNDKSKLGQFKSTVIVIRDNTHVLNVYTFLYYSIELDIPTTHLRLHHNYRNNNAQVNNVY